MRSSLLFALAAIASASTSSAQIVPQPKPTDPFDRVVDFEITKRFGSKEMTSERIFVQLPRHPGAQSPVLLLFHGAYYDRYWKNTNGMPPQHLNVPIAQLMDEMTFHGWIVASLEGGEAPDGGNGTYGNPEMQQRITAVLDYIDDEWGVDPDQICTLGHSMGAADAASYAARHQDPSGWRIAGVFSWSGVLNTAPGFAKPLWASSFFANGEQPWVATSVVQYGATCNTGTCDQNYDADQSQIFNLAEIPFTITHAMSDACFAICGFEVADELFMGGHLPNLVFDGGFNMNHTAYDSFDASLIRQFFEGCVLSPTLPLSAYKTVAVEDVTYFYFDVTTQSLKPPAVFGWDLSTANTLALTDVKNLAALRFRVDDPGNPAATPIDTTSGNVVIDCPSTTGALAFQLDNYLSTPTDVELNGMMANASDWEYDDTNGVLRLFAQPAGSIRWEITN